MRVLGHSRQKLDSTAVTGPYGLDEEVKSACVLEAEVGEASACCRLFSRAQTCSVHEENLSEMEPISRCLARTPALW